MRDENQENISQLRDTLACQISWFLSGHFVSQLRDKTLKIGIKGNPAMKTENFWFDKSSYSPNLIALKGKCDFTLYSEYTTFMLSSLNWETHFKSHNSKCKIIRLSLNWETFSTKIYKCLSIGRHNFSPNWATFQVIPDWDRWHQIRNFFFCPICPTYQLSDKLSEKWDYF